ncbi:hypothetical protein [Variovorax paradoxus]|uniref:hypothetical protein n=1 Tax=Variovorax paradoxus TaxID=34073 RepID=UPI0028593229|nr:hypothetical protein [Variovorax paradoxus]MDR6453886.1 hypothetical protein [Variovorax paradoxus]
MYGFQSSSARKARGAAPTARQSKVDGGLIRGPGTGTSDSIEKQVPEGTYIMPADSTAQLGDGELAGLGAPVPVRVSNGEYQLPPEQVHAVGVQALDAMKDATHAPADVARSFAPRGADPSVFFANGGDVSGPRSIDGFGFQPRGFANGGAVTDGERDRAVFGVYPKPSSTRSTNANDAALRRGVVATGPSSFQPAGVLPAASSSLARLNNLTDPRSTQFAGPASERAPVGFAPAGTAVPRSLEQEPLTAAAATPTAAPASVADATPASAQGFVASQRRNVLGSTEDANAQAAEIHAANASLPQGGATIIDGAGGAQAARQRFFDDANLRTAAARGSWSPRRGFQADEGAVRAAAVPVQARAAADIEQVRQDGDLQRAAVGFQSLTQREAAAARMQGERIAAEDRRAADTNSIRRDEVAGANRLRDVQVSAAQDEAALRRTLLDPNASTAERAKAQQALLAAQGKVASPEWSVQVTPATKNADGSSTEGSIYRVNKTTGDVQRVDGQGGGASAKFEKGSVYVDAQGRRAMYTGDGWELA